ncbi:hypothetical protein [Marinibactrum halimedae]|uniref:Uncharacterized protein n=1 Tax=Marinibactrum halimedae TaxID=1444977 RepID=A0AA37WN58_9GAMM|nr:hypothetical protein [Marinibactrum halimedae]MCD9458203.1 hypothetical protein [Marinibactrum halimedae]GLS27168.1 hypothetical protein GCM10007877_28870 [Marinibactrum halimedae]
MKIISTKALKYTLGFLAGLLSFSLFADPPPSSYIGFELTVTTQDQVFAELSATKETRLLTDPKMRGYCYLSNNGVYAAFGFNPNREIETIEISEEILGASCKLIDKPLAACLGELCLGQNRKDVQAKVKERITRIDDPANSTLEAIFYQYSMPLSEEQQRRFNDEYSEAYVLHNIWLKFDRDSLVYLGAIKKLDLP